MNVLLSFLVGLALPLLMGATTDQIWQNVYDSANTALRVNLVAGGGGGTITGGGASPQVATWSGATALTGDAGVTHSSTQLLSLGTTTGKTIMRSWFDSGTISFGFFFPDDDPSTSISALNIFDDGLTRAFDLISSDTNAVDIGMIATDSNNGTDPWYQANQVAVLGNATAGQGTWVVGNGGIKFGDNGSAKTLGSVTPDALNINGVTSGVVSVKTQDAAGTYNFNLPTTAGTAGQALLSGGGVGAAQTYGTLGVAAGGTGLTSGTSGGVLAYTASGTLASSGALTANVLTKGGGAGVVPTNSSITDNGTTVSTSEAVSTGAFSYNGKLTIADVGAENANFTVAHRIAYVTTGASTIAATMPASPTVGDTYTAVKADNGAGTIVWTRAGSQTLNGATTRTVSAQYKSDTCIYMASNVWICQGDGS